VIVILIAAAGVYFLFKKMSARPPQAPDQGPMQVQVSKPLIQDVMAYNEFTGNLASVESVDIRARVQGFLRRVAF